MYIWVYFVDVDVVGFVVVLDEGDGFEDLGYGCGENIVFFFYCFLDCIG